MLQHHKFENLGGANHGWLNAKHHFSFANYYDPQKLSHGELLVINDDRIAPQTGFDTHPHRDMEIITYVRKGAITHQDNKGNKGRTTAGNVQVMSAGTGIFHSEYNLEDEETNIYQIWIKPAEPGVEPKWDAAEFPKAPVTSALPLLVSGDGNAPLQINQDARIFAGRLGEGRELAHQITGKAYLLVSEGEVLVNTIHAKKGDGIAISDEKTVTLNAKTDAELLIIEVPGMNEAR
ncbi:MAG: pirin family protein [Alphaproteobacteria bacterium]|nr:pirin family protein [Alphaproteobacteria bacterium]